MGAGLGGGSADGAFALRALDALFGLGLGDAALAAYAARLGSDCPFFIYNRPMLAGGRGEVLEPFDLDLSSYSIKVVVPEGEHVSTAEAYAGLVPSGIEDLRSVLAMPVREWRGRLVNDFEESVFASHPAIAAAKRKLYEEGAAYASMSGSGSALFGVFVKSSSGKK